MQGKHVLPPRTETVIDLESFIAEDYFLRKVARVLEMSFVRDVTAACDAAGRGRRCGHPQDAAGTRDDDLPSTLERPRGKEQVPERRVGLRQQARSRSMPSGEVPDSKPGAVWQPETPCQFVGRLPARSTEIDLSDRNPKEVP